MGESWNPDICRSVTSIKICLQKKNSQVSNSHDQSCAACTCSCCMSMSILHVHVHVACPCECCMPMSMSIYIYIEMPECRTVRHPVSLVPDWKKLTIPEQVRYRTKLTQSGSFLVRYQTKTRDDGMPMPALVFSMPMPRYELTEQNSKDKTVRTGQWEEISKKSSTRTEQDSQNWIPRLR